MTFLSRLKSCIGKSNKRLGRTMSAWLGAALVLGLFATGCGDDDDDDDTPADIDDAQMRVEAASSFNDGNGMLDFDDPEGAVYSLTSAEVVVHQLELQLPEDLECDDVTDDIEDPVNCDEGELGIEDDELELEGPFVVDLVEGTTTLTTGDFTIPALDYEEIDLEFDSLAEDDDVDEADSDLIDHTFLGTASFEQNGSQRELFMQFSFATEASASADDENLSVGADDTLVIEFDVQSWFDGIPVSQCLEDGDLEEEDDRVTLDDEANGECDNAEEEFESNFEESMQTRIEPADDGTGYGDAGNGDAGNGDAGNGDTDNGDTDNGDTDNGDTDNGDTDNGDTDNGDDGGTL